MTREWLKLIQQLLLLVKLTRSTVLSVWENYFNLLGKVILPKPNSYLFLSLTRNFNAKVSKVTYLLESTGALQWKRVSVYINKNSQVVVKLKSKHVGAFSRNNKCKHLYSSRCLLSGKRRIHNSLSSFIL